MANIGKLISIEGIDGAGKTTVVNRLKEAVALMDTDLAFFGHYAPIFAREPGGTEFGETIRPLCRSAKITAAAQALLFYSGRVELFRTVTQPALERGQHVIYDRYYDSTFAYQGLTEEDRAMAVTLRETFLPDGVPDLTIFLDISFEQSEARLRKANEGNPEAPDRFDQMSRAQRRQILTNYDHLLLSEMDRFVIIDASQPFPLVYRDVVEALQLYLEQGMQRYWKYDSPNPVLLRNPSQ